MGSTNHPVIVVGSGIFGVSAALELQRRGYQVSLFDPGPLPHPNAASTDISKIIRMDYADDLYIDLMEEAFEGWHDWNTRWERPLYHESGFLLMACSNMQPGDFEYECFTRLELRGYPVERIKSGDLRKRFPAWASEKYPDGYYNPNAGWAESGEVVAHLVQEVQAAGVELYQGVAFAGLLEDGSRVGGIRTDDGSVFRSRSVIIAAGSWTPMLFPHLRDMMWPIGQPVLHFRPKNYYDYHPPTFPVWAADIHNSGWYGFPTNNDGILKVANHGPGWMLDPSRERIVPLSEEARFRKFFEESISNLVDAPLVSTRLCFYCDTWDGNFWIDFDPEREGLLVCTGDSGHGFKFAPVLGIVTADVFEGKSNQYTQRFAWRIPKDNTGQNSLGVSPTPRK